MPEYDGLPYPNAGELPDVPGDMLELVQALSLRFAAIPVQGINTYRWDTDAEAGTQTGMSTGDLAYSAENGGSVWQYLGSWKILFSAWRSYGSASSFNNITLGSGGTHSLEYRHHFGDIDVRWSLTLGSSGFAVGTTPTLALPVNSAAYAHPYLPFRSSGSLFDVGSTVIRLGIVVGDVSAVNRVRIAFLDSVSGLITYVSAASPWTWAAGDSMRGEFSYSAAS